MPHMTISSHALKQARTRMRRLQDASSVVSVKYQRTARRVRFDLVSGVQVSVPVDRIQGLANATPRELSRIEISPSGLGLHWPLLDADVYVPALMAGALGNRKWMASLQGSEVG